MAKLDQRFPIYGRLLRLYPAAYQKRYRQQMLQTLDDMLQDANTKTERAAIWARNVLEFPISLTQQQLSYIGAVMSHDTPNYVKRNAIIGTALLAPFFLTIASGILYNDRVMTSRPGAVTFTILLIGLPALACVINALTYLKWSSERRSQAHTSFWQSLFDLSHNWPMLLTAGLGLLIVMFVFGHDSVHCIAGNPVTEIHHWHQTLQCIKQG